MPTSSVWGEGQAFLGGGGGGEAGLKAKSPHKAGFWKMALRRDSNLIYNYLNLYK
ncbi:TPA: hypothetical protein ACSPKT_003833 [Pseudomonas aeruginosa]